ncbi:MAG: NTP transferase domain-containing protein [Chitinophagaceae bacterium]
MPEQKNKHAKLTHPANGNFGRNEWSFTGTNCDNIKALASVLIAAFSKEINCAYIDTHHHKSEEPLMAPSMLKDGAIMEYSNQISYTEFRLNTISDINMQEWFTQADLILVNGNHHAAANQVIVIDEKKKSSLEKRMPGLNNIKLVLLADGVTEPFDFVQESLAAKARAIASREEQSYEQERGRSNAGANQTAILSINDHEGVINFFRQEIQQSRPPLFGLVLAGGKSQRMGLDKTGLTWHGKEQRYHLADELKKYCAEVYISCREDQQSDIVGGYKSIPDSFTGLGPYGAILSAFREYPDSAWLVLASDLPLLTGKTIEYLVANRVRKSVATAYAQPQSGKPEPLIAIWEPKSYPVLLSFLSRGYSCPKKVLQHSVVSLLQATHASELMNVNTPEEKDLATKLLLAQNQGHHEGNN